MARSTRRAMLAALGVAGGAVAVTAAVGLWSGAPPLAVALPAVLAAAALLWAAGLVREHMGDLERLTSDAIGGAAGVAPREPPASPEVARLDGVLRGLLESRDSLPDVRLAAVLAAVPDALLVVTETGLVSLANGPATELFEPQIGGSAYALFVRDSLLAGIEAASDSPRPVATELEALDGSVLAVRLCRLPDGSGTVICVPASAIRHRIELRHDLRLHDEPPPPEPVTDATPLDRLPVLVLDTETTGLDVERDRVVAIGAVRANGGRIYPSHALDLLVDPGVPVPAVAQAVHGISAAMLAGKPPFREVWPAVRTMADGCVWIGHNIGFDTALLRREARLAGLEWTEPVTLDTAHLAAGLLPDLSGTELDTVAAALGVPVHGRHTALGDAHVTAGIWGRLLARMAVEGIVDFGGAKAVAARARSLRAAQKRAGW